MCRLCGGQAKSSFALAWPAWKVSLRKKEEQVGLASGRRVERPVALAAAMNGAGEEGDRRVGGGARSERRAGERATGGGGGLSPRPEAVVLRAGLAAGSSRPVWLRRSFTLATGLRCSVKMDAVHHRRRGGRGGRRSSHTWRWGRRRHRLTALTQVAQAVVWLWCRRPHAGGKSGGRRRHGAPERHRGRGAKAG